MKPLRMLTPLLILVCVLIWCPPNSINADTDPAQVAALLDMYNFLSSRDQLSNWNTNSGDPCGQAWIGVTCSGSSITELKLSGLGLVGSMGYKFTNLVSLINLDLSNNHLANGIPYPLPPNARNINLAGNNLSGVLPYSISNLTSLEYLNVSHNQLQGQLNEIFKELSALSTMDLSFNSFTGNLPQSFASLSSMTSMFLENNQFTGTVNVLANISLKTLDISNNQFTGWVPDQLKNISLLKDGNLWNSGSAPPPPPGTPPYSPSKPNHKSSSNNKPSSQSSSNSDGSKSGVGGGVIVAIIVISVLAVGALVAFVIMKKRSRSSPDIEKHNNQPSLPAPSNEVQEIKPYQTSAAISSKTFEVSPSINLRPPPVEQNKSFDDEDFSKQPIVVKKVNTMAIDAQSYSIAELQIATNSFSAENLIGEGSFGRIYRAQFSDGKVVAVKKIDSFALSNHMSEDFMEIVASISQLHHQNISELVGYCSQHEQHLLVYEFHNNGSLHELLHLSDEGSKPLTWNSRVKIALGTARALEYLHEVCSPSIVHKNIKSSKILLDMELNPHLSDSGLASVIPNVEQILNNNAGSGYNAPEVDMSGQYTLKSDVYSFGVAMLELLTGRKPFDILRPRSEQVLVGWAMPQLHDIDALGKMVDPALEGLYPVKSLSRFADVIALCIQVEPEFRPSMSEVVQSLVRLVQRANMSRRTVGTDRKAYQRAHSLDGSYQRADSLDETHQRADSLDWKDLS